jgi:sec-independent protein translocase protein TatA
MVGDILQPTHLVFVLIVALLVLGPKRLPEVGRQLGSGLRDFRAAMNGEHSEHHEEVGTTHTSVQTEPVLGSQSSEMPAQHEFGHEVSEPIGDAHQFAHHAPEAAVEPEVTSERADTSVEHEFAYETSQPADKPADPRS